MEAENSKLITLHGCSFRRSSLRASQHPYTRVRLRKSASNRRAIFPSHPSARKQVQDCRRFLSSSCPLAEFPWTPLPAASWQGRTSQARRSSNLEGSSLSNARADFAVPAATPAQLPENGWH